MDKDTIEKMKDLLQSQKREILDTLIATNADFRAIVDNRRRVDEVGQSSTACATRIQSDDCTALQE